LHLDGDRKHRLAVDEVHVHDQIGAVLSRHDVAEVCGLDADLGVRGQFEPQRFLEQLRSKLGPITK